MKKVHQEIDELRKRGALKEALDLARYSHTQRPRHLQIQRSYGWAIYSHLKQKVTAIKELLRDGSIQPIEIVSATHPRVIELNQLCQEYRVNKLLIEDLCYSLILRNLCRLTPPPLGLYGLLKWSRAAGMRAEDYEPYESSKEAKDSIKRSSSPLKPLILEVAEGLAEMMISIDQVENKSHVLETLDSDELADFASRVHLHAIEKCSESPRSMMWSALWLSRRAGSSAQGVECALVLLQETPLRPDIWWELALCLAHVTNLDVFKMSLEPLKQTSSELENAYFFSLRSISEARTQGISENRLSASYAQAGYWAHYLGRSREARALIGRAIYLLKTSASPVPFNWVRDLSTLGGEISHPDELFSSSHQQMNQHTDKWIEQKMKYNTQ